MGGEEKKKGKKKGGKNLSLMRVHFGTREIRKGEKGRKKRKGRGKKGEGEKERE